MVMAGVKMVTLKCKGGICIMKRHEQILIKLEFDRSIKYLNSRKEKLTVEECMQGIS